MILFPLAIALNFHKIAATHWRPNAPEYLWQRRNSGAHFAWFSARVLTRPFNRHPMAGGKQMTHSGQGRLGY